MQVQRCKHIMTIHPGREAKGLSVCVVVIGSFLDRSKARTTFPAALTVTGECGKPAYAWLDHLHSHPPKGSDTEVTKYCLFFWRTVISQMAMSCSSMFQLSCVHQCFLQSVTHRESENHQNSLISPSFLTILRILRIMCVYICMVPPKKTYVHITFAGICNILCLFWVAF